MTHHDDVPSQADIAAAFGNAGLAVSPQRLVAHHDTYVSTLALIRKVSAPALGETAPAAGFNAGWD